MKCRALQIIALSLLSMTSSIAYSEKNSCENEWDQNIDKNRAKYTAKVSDCLSAVENENTTAQVNLGLVYYYGLGVEKDFGKAKTLWEIAAEKNHPRALNGLGILAAEGKGRQKDLKDAVKLFREAINQGSVKALASLGRMYEAGGGVEQDYAEAARLYTLAADKGMARAQNNIGYFYQKGLGVKKDYAEAVRFYKLAIDKGDPLGQTNLAFLYEHGHGVEQDYAEAARLYELAAEQENAFAQNKLGYLHHEGLGVRKDEKAAIAFYEKATGNGSVDAMVALGRIYRYHENVTVKYMNKAVNLFSAAADQGDPRAQFELGKLYQYPPMVVGSPIKKDIDVAIKLYRLAADQDYSYGIFMLGYIYSRNIKATDDPAGPVDDEKAAELYTKASDRGLPIATAYLARAYLQGNGVRRDRKYALRLLEKAAEEGVGKAFNLLGKLYDPKKTGRLWSVKDLNIEKDLQKSYKMYQAAADRGINFAASAASRKKLEIERIKGEALREEQLDALGSTPTGPAIFVQADTQYWDCKSAIGDLILNDLYDVVRRLAIRTDIPEPDSDACSYSVKADHDTGDDSKRVRINWYTSADNMEICLRETCATKYTASFGVWGAHIGFESIYASIQVFQPILTGVEKENSACMDIEYNSVDYKKRPKHDGAYKCDKLSALRR